MRLFQQVKTGGLYGQGQLQAALGSGVGKGFKIPKFDNDRRTWNTVCQCCVLMSDVLQVIAPAPCFDDLVIVRCPSRTFLIGAQTMGLSLTREFVSAIMRSGEYMWSRKKFLSPWVIHVSRITVMVFEF